ncbi:MAG: hypothetical protein LC768_16335 [Acidobacteria bacterium]|nr:hypothetical protein [Acidobacteriota bacterium]MCA1639867.1 hypothetical protein [Acidobacteriota bacterium]
MKKHILGFALFSFIVGATAFVYAMFNVVRVKEVSAPTYSQTYSSKTSCWRTKRQLKESNFGSPIIEQAVFNLKTKQFSWKLATAEADLPIALHFFIKDDEETRYIYSEQYVAGSRDGELKFTNSRLSPNNLDSDENLYVIADFVPTSKRYNKNFQPEFDASRATAVSIDFGK